jgi:hypothetical protein
MNEQQSVGIIMLALLLSFVAISNTSINGINGTNGTNGIDGLNGINQSDSTKVNKTGDTMTGDLNAGAKNITAGTFQGAGTTNYGGSGTTSLVMSSTRVGSSNAMGVNTTQKILFPIQATTNRYYSTGGVWFNSSAGKLIVGGSQSYEYVASDVLPGVTQNISVLSALPSTFTVLQFRNGILIGVS